MIVRLAVKAQGLLDRLAVVDFMPSLLLRVYLAPIFWMAGTQKAAHFADTVAWFGNPEWGLGLPFPAAMAFLATAAELGGAIALILGFALRWEGSTPISACTNRQDTSWSWRWRSNGP